MVILQNYNVIVIMRYSYYNVNHICTLVRKICILCDNYFVTIEICSGISNRKVRIRIFKYYRYIHSGGGMGEGKGEITVANLREYQIFLKKSSRLTCIDLRPMCCIEETCILRHFIKFFLNIQI